MIRIYRKPFSTFVLGSIGSTSNITRIRIWKSGYFGPDRVFVHTNVITALWNIKPSRQPNIGHVSLETKDIYASLWPRGINVTNKLKSQSSDRYEHSPETDELAEARPPDLLIDLYSLETDNIKCELDKFIKSGSMYHILGSNPYLKTFGAHSCSSLAYHLLSAGGVHKLGINPHFIRDYIVVTPNNLVKLVIDAYNKEQLIYKEK